MDNDKQKNVNNRRSNYKYSNHNYSQGNNQRRGSYYQNNNKRRNINYSNLESDEMKFSDELDTSFIEKRRVNKNKVMRDLDNSYKKEIRPRSGKLKVVFHIFLVVILLVITVLCTSLYFIYISPLPFKYSYNNLQN